MTHKHTPRPPESGRGGNARWATHRERLLKLRERLLAEQRDHAADTTNTTAAYHAHPADVATDEFDREFALSLRSARQDALYEIDEALGRIASGRYGVCELTGRPIPAERLAAVPWTRFTVEAEAELERQGIVQRTRLRDLQPVKTDEAETLEASEQQAAEERPTSPRAGRRRAPRTEEGEP